MHYAKEILSLGDSNRKQRLGGMPMTFINSFFHIFKVCQSFKNQLDEKAADRERAFNVIGGASFLGIDRTARSGFDG